MSPKSIFLLFVTLFSMNANNLWAQTSSGTFKFWANGQLSAKSYFDTLFGDSFEISQGLMSNTLFEMHAGGDGQSLTGIRLQRKNIPRKETNWLRPLALVDVVTPRDTLLNVAVGVPVDDSITKFGDFDWESMMPLKNVTAFDEHFVADQFILPLPCNHFPINVTYWGPKECTLSLDDDFADGLNLEQVIPFLEDQKFHFEAYHGAHCGEIMKDVIFDIQTRHADIQEINRFVEQLTHLGFKLKVFYPEN